MLNQLDPDLRRAAWSAIEHVLKIISEEVFTSTVVDHSSPPYLDGLRFDAKGISIWASDQELRVAIGHMSSPPAARHMRLVELAEFRPMPLPQDFEEIRARLLIWLDEVVKPTHADELARNDREERAAIDAAVAAATAWNTDWENLILSPFCSRTEVLVAAEHDSLECSTAQTSPKTDQWTMSNALRKEVQRLPFSSSLQADQRGIDGTNVIFWGPMPSFIYNQLSPLDKMRAIARAQARNLRFLYW